MRFRIRVDQIKPNTVDLLKEMLKTSAQHVLVYHLDREGRNPHYHAYVEDTRFLSAQAYRYHVDSRLGVKGPERSVKACDDERVDEYIQYLFHEKHGNRAILIEATLDVGVHRQKAKEVAQEFEKVKSKKARKTREEPTTWDLAEQVREQLAADNRDPLSEAELYEWATDYAIEVCRKARKTFTDFSIQRIVQTAVTANKETRELFKRRVVARMISH